MTGTAQRKTQDGEIGAYIYALRDPRDGVIQYVGKAKDHEERLRGHLKDWRRKQTPVAAWVGVLRRANVRPEMILLESIVCSVGSGGWAAAERRWIAELRPALNLAIGGPGRVGAPVSAETRKKISLAGTGRVWSEETRRKVRLAQQERARRGWRMPEAARAVLRVKAVGRRHSLETRRKLSAARRGVPKSAPHRAAIGAAHRGRTFTEATLAKMRAAKAGWSPPESLRTATREMNRGAGNGRAKLTEANVVEIRSRYAAGGMTLVKLGEAYGVNASMVSRIVRRTAWRHL